MPAPPDRAQPPPGVRIEHSVRIEAPPDAIWRILEDVDGWSAWNPLYAAASGSIQPGETIDFMVVLPGFKPQAARATVRVSEPAAVLHYATGGKGGLMQNCRYVHIAPMGADACEVTNGESMGGLLGPVVAALLGARIGAALQGMNDALKRKAEAGV